MKDIQHIFFDLDGTLSDPRECILNCIRFALSESGCEAPSDTKLVEYIGPSLRDAFSELLQTSDINRIEAAVSLYRERFGSTGMFENALYPGIPELLAELRFQGKVLFVVTAKPHCFAVPIIDHFELSGHFQNVYGPELDGTYDDKADLISHILQENEITADSCAMIGDRKNDIIAAKKNDVPSVGVTYGYGTKLEIRKAGADYFCDSPEEIGDLFLSEESS